MNPRRYELLVPDLDLPQATVIASVWFKQVGDEVVEGESVLELSAGEVVVDLPAPTTGFLTQQLVEEDDRLKCGQLVAIFLAESPESR